MGKSNTAIRQYLSNKTRFADIVNGTIFEGEQVIHPEDLEKVDGESAILLQDKEGKEKNVQRLSGWNEVGKRYKVNEKIPKIIEVADSSEIEQLFDTCEIVWFLDTSRKLEFEKYYFLPMIKAVESGKELIMSTQLRKKLSMYIPKENMKLYNNPFSKDIEDSLREELATINTPVVFVCSVFEGLDKFSIQLQLRKEITRRGYKTIVIGSREEAEYFDMYRIPQYMFGTEYKEEEKVFRLNAYLKEIECKESPDIIVIGIPGELFVASMKYVAHFGFLALEMFMACTPDIVVMSLPYEEYEYDDFEKYRRSVRSRFGVDVDCFNLTSKRLILDETEIHQKFEYLDVKKISDNEKRLKEDVFMLENEKEVLRMTDFILKKLEKYAEIDSV